MKTSHKFSIGDTVSLMYDVQVYSQVLISISKGIKGLMVSEDRVYFGPKSKNNFMVVYVKKIAMSRMILTEKFNPNLSLSEHEMQNIRYGKNYNIRAYAVN